eukprot:967247-Pleurochrysis_carterae.AAC.1
MRKGALMPSARFTTRHPFGTLRRMGRRQVPSSSYFFESTDLARSIARVEGNFSSRTVSAAFGRLRSAFAARTRAHARRNAARGLSLLQAGQLRAGDRRGGATRALHSTFCKGADNAESLPSLTRCLVPW